MVSDAVSGSRDLNRGLRQEVRGVLHLGEPAVVEGRAATNALAGQVKVSSCTACSGGKKAGFLGRSGTLTFPVTTDFNTPGVMNLNLYLAAGANTIEIANPSANAPDVGPHPGCRRAELLNSPLPHGCGLPVGGMAADGAPETGHPGCSGRAGLAASQSSQV